ncbi:MAG: glycosyltransferase family 2 protein, partial [Lachnospiraceae bacterium]|nr:glycosyltransferase family 2 protein [Lachnospiraceae bacterium]
MARNLEKVSIIVPVYNAQDRLERCIESICAQTYREIEILLINDGSTDSSKDICEKFANIDQRIRIINKKNTGVSDSRNIAINLAEGKYIQFIDSDDWIVPEATELLVRAAEKWKCGLVISDFYRVINDRISRKGDISEEALLTRKEYALFMMEKPADFYYGVLWNKLFRRDFIEKFHLRMDAEVSWCEDFMFNMEYIRHIEEVYVLKMPIYYYVKTKGSLSTQGVNIVKTLRMKLSVFEYYKMFYRDVFDELDYEKIHLQMYRFLFDAASDGLVPPAILPGNYQLGKERMGIGTSISEDDEILMDAYRERKLFMKCLEPVALRFYLKPEETLLLLYLNEHQQTHNKKELADYIGISVGKLLNSLRHLAFKKYISWEKAKSSYQDDTEISDEQLEIKILSSANEVLEELQLMKEDFTRLKYDGFTEEEEKVCL